MPYNYNPIEDTLDYFSEIGKYCPSGDTFPTSPTNSQWFLHTPTGRSWLYQYRGATWIPMFAFGTSTIFFDPTGTDSQSKGFGSGTDAYATPNYAYSQIPALFSGAITIYGAGGTYDQAVALGGKTATGAFAINFIGSTTSLDSGTMNSSVQGTGATRGSITDTTKAWTTDQFKGKFVKVGTTYRVIFSNDATTLTIQGTFPSLPSGVYSIEEIATNFSRTTGSAITFLTGTYNHNFSLCKMSSSGASSLVVSGSLGQMTFTNCHLSADGVGTTLYQGSYFIPAFSYCYFSVTNTSAYVCNAIANCAFTFYGNYVRSISGTKANNGMVFGAGCYLVAAIGNTWDNFSNAIQLTGVGSATFATAASNGYNFFINNANGINVITGAAISSITNNQYSGNTTNIAHAWTPGETVFQALRNSVAPVIARQASGGTVALIQAQNSSSQVLAQVDTNGGAVFNEQGSASADFRVEGDTLANLFFVDASADNVGINTATPSSGFDIQRSMGWKVNTISTNTTLDVTHNVVLASGTITITLPTAVGNNRVYAIKKTDATTILTINTSLSQTIDGNTSVQLTTQYSSITVISNGANWFII